MSKLVPLSTVLVAFALGCGGASRTPGESAPAPEPGAASEPEPASQPEPVPEPAPEPVPEPEPEPKASTATKAETAAPPTEEPKVEPLLQELFSESDLSREAIYHLIHGLDRIGPGWTEHDMTPQWVRKLKKLEQQFEKLRKRYQRNAYFRAVYDYCIETGENEGVAPEPIDDRDLDESVVMDGHDMFMQLDSVAAEIVITIGELGDTQAASVARELLPTHVFLGAEYIQDCSPVNRSDE